jgi:ribonuclease-3
VAGERRRQRLRALLESAGFKDVPLDAVERAFVHESAAKERHLRSNERLEFLGDAVLDLVVARWVFDRFPDDKEGVLHKRRAAIINDAAIARSAKRLGFADLLELGAGERAHGGAERASILGDAFEAFVAALYLELGLAAAERFILSGHVPFVDVEQPEASDPKTQLQELTQGRLSCMPLYAEHAQGPAHQRVFTSTVQVGGETLGTGTGPSKKTAQQQAAAQALRTLQERFGLTHATQED